MGILVNFITRLIPPISSFRIHWISFFWFKTWLWTWRILNFHWSCILSCVSYWSSALAADVTSSHVKLASLNTKSSLKLGSFAYERTCHYLMYFIQVVFFLMVKSVSYLHKVSLYLFFPTRKCHVWGLDDKKACFCL